MCAGPAGVALGRGAALAIPKLSVGLLAASGALVVGSAVTLVSGGREVHLAQARLADCDTRREATLVGCAPNETRPTVRCDPSPRRNSRHAKKWCSGCEISSLPWA